MERLFNAVLRLIVIPVAIVALFLYVIKLDLPTAILMGVLTLIFGFLSWKAYLNKNNTGTRDLDRILEAELVTLVKEGQKDLNEIEHIAKTTKSREISQSALKLYELGQKIMAFLHNNPEKITKARRFFNYYLKTAQTLLNKYYGFEKNGIQADEIAHLEHRTVEAMTLLNDSFRKQYISLTTNERLDVEAEIDLLEKESKLNF